MLTTTAPRIWHVVGIGIIVPAGYESSGFSIPLLLRPVASLLGITQYGRYSQCAVLHDYLCESGMRRSQADRAFREALDQEGASAPLRCLLWISVRVGGWLGY
jgi:hypothetical protein